MCIQTAKPKKNCKRDFREHIVWQSQCSKFHPEENLKKKLNLTDIFFSFFFFLILALRDRQNFQLDICFPYTVTELEGKSMNRVVGT